MDRGKLEAPEPSDHELFRESIAELDRIVRASFRTTAVQITAAIAAIAAPLILGGVAEKAHINIADIIYASLFLILALQIRDLFRHGRTALVRERLSKQLKAAVVQRIRANKLYDLSILDPLTGLHNRRFGAQRRSAGGATVRSRLFQGDQRPVRTRRWRCGPEGILAKIEARDSRVRRARPNRRGRVPGDPAGMPAGEGGQNPGAHRNAGNPAQ
jgi:hypothetical protein